MHILFIKATEIDDQIVYSLATFCTISFHDTYYVMSILLIGNQHLHKESLKFILHAFILHDQFLLHKFTDGWFLLQ
jgi:hypothetical protein